MTNAGKGFIEVSVRDTVSGIASVTTTQQDNVTVSIPSFVTGTQSSLILRATRIDQSQSGHVGFEIVNVDGKVTECGDPV